jgi:predicted short-subunit dehydrogenase-like oxidoreductase (DUF2520 family)
MLPGMCAKASAKQSVAIVGAGNLASALALALCRAGYGVEQIVSRSSAPSMRRARKLAREVGTSAVAAVRARISAEIVWFGVPDGAIAGAARSLVGAADWKGKVALHSSGALTSDELAMLRKRGASVASVHPLMTFVRGSRPLLAGVPFAIEGDVKAVRTARAMVRELHAEPFSIRKNQKAAYHAWGMFASPLLTALLAAGERVAEAAGVNRKTARERMLPILEQTLTNYAWLGASGAFSGPIARGDVATVHKHLEVLSGIPGAREVYLALARAALRDLPARNRPALKDILRTE